MTHPTENIDAYRLYLAGRNAMRGQQKVENVQAALAFFEQALQKDGSFASVYAGISDGSLRMYRSTRDSAWIDKALSAAQQARRLDDKLVEAHLSLGSIYQATGKAAEAIAELTVASELAPNSDDVFRRLGRAYLATGRGPESVQSVREGHQSQSLLLGKLQRTRGCAHPARQLLARGGSASKGDRARAKERQRT